MFQFLLRRLIVALLVAATVMVLAFVLTRLSGDLATSIAGPNATAADIEAIRKAYSLDRPVITQFFDWVGRAVTGDLGDSYFFKARVASLIGERMPVTLTLGLTGLVIALVVSLPLGILAAVREHTGLGVPDVGLGDILPDPANIPPGYRFHPRCPIAEPRCSVARPALKPRPTGGVECLLAPDSH